MKAAPWALTWPTTPPAGQRLPMDQSTSWVRSLRRERAPSMGMKDTQHEAGMELRREMFGPGGSDNIVDNTTDVNDRLEDYVTRVCFGDIWQRPGLELVDRSKITVAMLLATGKSHEIRVHMRGALQNG